jgi:hypothetical protein
MKPRPPAALAVLVALVAATPAQAETVSVARSAARDCLTPAAGQRGVATVRFEAPRTGLVTYRLRARSGDWDLALFDARTGTRLAGSAAFRARELARAFVRRGQAVDVQACRRSGTSRRATLDRAFTQLVRDDSVARMSLVRVPFVNRSVVPVLEGLGLDVTHNIRANHVDVVLHGEADRAKLAGIGLPFSVLDADLLATARSERRKDAAYAKALRAQGSALPTGRTDYRLPEDYANELKQLAERFPSLIRTITPQEKSLEGRELGAIEIAGDVADDRGRPVFFVNALHHAREWPAAEVSLEFAHELANGYGSDARITKLLDQVRIVVMPVVNPDGFQVSRTAPNPDPDEEMGVGTVYSTGTGVVVLGGSLGYKRKNCNPGTAVALGTPCELAIGVDPNRNYGESWGGPGASSNPNDQSYRGSGPFSEPEPRAVKELTSKLNPTGMITVHNVAALVLRPPGLEADGFAPDEEYMKALGERMAAATGYENQYGWQLYDTTGTTDDWSYPATGGFGYTVELGPSDGYFHGNYEDHVVRQWTGDGETAVGGMREALLTAAEHARDAAFAGRIAGRAPAGRTLRIKKAFQTASFAVCAISDPLPVGLNLPGGGSTDVCAPQGEVIMTDELLDFTTTVPASGRYEWWVNPSTRPFEGREGKVEAYTLTCEDAGKVLETTEVVIGRGETKAIDLPCGGTLPAGDGSSNAVSAKVLSVSRRKGGRVAAVRVRALGGSLTGARIAVRRGKRTLGATTVKSLSGTRTIKVAIRKGRLGKRRYAVTVRAGNLTVTRTVKAR